MNSQDFIDAGYRRFKEVGRRSADFLLQKRIYDVNGTKYFLNVFAYFHEGREAFEAEVHFAKDGKPYNVVFWEFESVEEVEKAFDHMWDRMCFDYRERNQ